MDIYMIQKGILHNLISGQMSKYTKFNLRIISIYKYISILRNKCLSNQSAKFQFHRNILEVRISRTDTAGRCDRLVKGSVNPAIF